VRPLFDVVLKFAGICLLALTPTIGCSSNGGDDSSASAAGAPSGSGGRASAGGGVSSTEGGASHAGTNSGGDAAAGLGSTSSGGVGTDGGATASGGAGNSSAGTGNQDAGASSGGSASGGKSGSAGSASGGTTNGGAGSTNGGGAGSAGTAGSSGGVASSVSVISSNVTWYDDAHNPVNAHGGGLNRVGDTFYMSGEYFVYSAGASETTNNSFHGFSMYSSKDLVNWHFERMVLPQQASGELGPMRNGERPHIIQCPSSGEWILYAHAASLDYQTDKEVVYATSPTINGVYAYKGPLKNASGQIAAHTDMNAYVDSAGVPYVVTESGHVYKLAADCHSWLSDQAFGAMANMESPAPFKAGSSYFWIMSNKTGWRANDDEYATAPSMLGPWTNQGLIAPAGEKTWLSQSTCVLPITGSKGTVYLYWGDHWDGTESTAHPGRNNSLATYVFQPLVITGTKASMPVYYAQWKLNIAEGTWSP